MSPQPGVPKSVALHAMDDAIAAVALPGRGYFGALDSDCLEVRVGLTVAAITLRLAERAPAFLNLEGIEVHDEAGAVVMEEGGYRAEISSSIHDDAVHGPNALLRGSGIHSRCELAPWWTVRFKAPIEVASVRVRNRADAWGLRSRSLQVIVETIEGGRVLVFDGLSRTSFLDTLGTVGHAACLGGAGGPVPDSPGAAAHLRRRMLGGLSTRLRAGTLPLDRTPWRHVLQLIDLWSGAAPDDEGWTVLAGFLLAQHGFRQGSSIRAFACLLATRERLHRLEEEINVLAGAYGGRRLILTRHGLSPLGELDRGAGIVLDHLADIVHILDGMGRQPVLAYGTLLGAVRDATFIAHDDDVDILYRSQASDRAGVVEDLAILRRALQARGYRVDSLLPNNLNMHVVRESTGALMDVFPCWIQDEGLMLHMERMKLRAIRPGIVHPRGWIELHGRTFPAPADPAAFLGERYGPGWRTPDPYFEWPWQLEEYGS